MASGSVPVAAGAAAYAARCSVTDVCVAICCFNAAASEAIQLPVNWPVV